MAMSPENRELESEWTRIRTRILAKAGFLGRQGALIARHDKGEPLVWRLRFVEDFGMGIRSHRSITIGSHPELVRRARELLGRCRERAKWEDELENLRKTSEAIAVTTRGWITARHG